MSRSMESKIILQQITPIIHFQCQQDGATIRATELKPKLDRFILRIAKVLADCDSERKEELVCKLSGTATSNSKLNSELIATIQRIFYEKQHEKQIKAEGRCLEYFLESNTGELSALNYKIRIYTDENDKKSKYISDLNEDTTGYVCVEEKKRSTKQTGIGAYFFTEKINPKQASFYKKVTIKIICFNPYLKQMIETLIPMMIAVSNFGYRQDKGFGHFFVSYINDKAIQLTQESLIRTYCTIFQSEYSLYKHEYKNMANYKRVLNNIGQYCQVMKSGINTPNKNYIPSYMLKESQMHKRFTNEKKYLKSLLLKEEKLEFPVQQDSNISEIRNETRYFRGLLGFADHYTFTKLHIKGDKKFEYSLTFNVTYQSKYESEFSSKRCASPLYFIPVGKDENNIKSILMMVDKESLSILQKQGLTVRFQFNRDCIEVFQLNKKDNKEFYSAVKNKEKKKMQQNKLLAILEDLIPNRSLKLTLLENFQIDEFIKDYHTYLKEEGYSHRINSYDIII